MQQGEKPLKCNVYSPLAHRAVYVPVETFGAADGDVGEAVRISGDVLATGHDHRLEK